MIDSEEPTLSDADSHLLGLMREVAAVAAETEPPRPVKIDHYLVLQELGRGGQSVALLAYDHKLERRVVLKLFWNERHRDRILMEGKSLVRVDSPFVAKCYATGEYQETPYLVLEYVEGQSLATAGRGNSKSAGQLIIQIAEGLKAIHHAGLAHGDIKPSNIIVGAHGKATIIDLGLAIAVTDEPSSCSHGTIAYMAPERARGEAEADPRQSDLFSLGGVLRFLLSGRAPFEADTKAEALERARDGDMSSADTLDSRVPGRLRRACQKSLSPECSARFTTVEQFIAAVRPRRLRGLPPLVAACVLALAGWGLYCYSLPSYREASKDQLKDENPLVQEAAPDVGRAPAKSGATITVTTDMDLIRNDGLVSLREAVLAANSNCSIDGSEAGTGADRIVFASHLTAPIRLTKGPLEIEDEVEIVGNGRYNTVLQANDHVVFVTRDQATVRLSIRSLAIKNAMVAIQHHATGKLTLTDCAINTCADGVSLPVAKGYFARCRFIGNMQAIDSGGALRIEDCRFAKNGIPGQWAIRSAATLCIDRCTFFENQVEDIEQSELKHSGLIDVCRATGVLTLRQCTLDGNQGGLVRTSEGSRVLVSQCTIVGGGLPPSFLGPATIEGTILSGHRNENGSPCDLVPSEGLVLRYSLVGALPLASQKKLGVNESNLLGSASNPLDPGLRARSNDGGRRLTQTMVPRAGSPVIDRGLAGGLETDQRGSPRVNGPAADIGAVEYQSPGDPK